MYTTHFKCCDHLPVARNPQAYAAPGSKVPKLDPPPPNFSDQGVRRAAGIMVRPSNAEPHIRQPVAEFPQVLRGVAPADQVPIREMGTRPDSKVRAFISTRSNGVILYQNRQNGYRPR